VWTVGNVKIAVEASMKARSQAKLKRYRRYDTAGAMGTLGALPRPRARKLSRRWALLGVLVLLVLGVVLYVSFSDTFYVTRVGVVGNTRTAPLEILQASNIGGEHILWVSHADAERRIVQGIPSIKSARVDCQLPNRCVIKVQEREPLVAWQFGRAVTWLDDDGVAFAALGQGEENANLIVVEALQGPALLPGEEADPKLVKAVLAVIHEIPDVRHYRYSSEHGLEFDDARGFPIYLGLGENMADRAMIWKSLRAQLAQNGVTPKFVDLRFALAPYYVENTDQ
jgi:cell division septal protein FtsQ